MKKVATCPLKLILFGEHSVLQGTKCIAVCINKYGYLGISNNIEDKNVLVKDIQNNGFTLVLENGIIIEKEMKTQNKIITLDYYLGSGLGTSACVSLLSSVSYFYKTEIFKKQSKNSIWPSIYKKSDEIENFFHGKSSGVDICTCKTGGLIVFQNGEYEQLNYECLSKYKILIYNSKISKDTALVVKSNLKDKDLNYAKLGDIAERAYKIIKNKFVLEDFYNVIKEAQCVLEELGVVPDTMMDEVRRLRQIGIESKITGAGNGGHLFTLVSKNVSIPNWEEVLIEPKGLVIY